jgi:hypothetical protein
MKNYLFFVIAVLAIFFASCSHQVEQKDLKISVRLDTFVTNHEPLTAPRYSCDGKLLPEPKLIGMTQTANHFSLKKDTVISREVLADHGFSDRKESGYGVFGVIQDLLLLLLGILVIALLFFLTALIIWALIRLIKWLFKKRVTPSSDPAAQASTAGSPAVPPVPPVPPAGSGPIYYIGNVENLHIHSNESVVAPSPKKKSTSRGKGNK